MRISEIGFDGPQPIDSYGGGGFRIGGAFQAGSLILTPDGATGWNGAPDAAAFAPVLDHAAEIDVLLIGMGAEIAPVPRALRTALETAGIGVEAMATPAACRTYNVLLAEDRRVAAALVAV